jgi:hypothetical protein
VVKAGTQDAQLTDFVAMRVMIGIFKVLEPMQL